MTEMATIDWFGRWGTSVFSEDTAIFRSTFEDTSMGFLTQKMCHIGKEPDRNFSKLSNLLG